jgi:hypothetical protein
VRGLAAIPAATLPRARTAVLLAVILAGLMTVSTAVAQAGPLIGSAATQTFVDTNSPGVAKAFRYTAATTGMVGRLNVYVDATSTAGAVHVGLYSNKNDRPATRLAACSVSAPKAGWNDCAVTAAKVTARTKYWLAVLAPSTTTGRLAFRDRPGDGTISYASSSSPLASMPSGFPVGAKRTGYSPASINGVTATATADTTAPTAPGSLAKTAATQTSVSLGWTA